MRGKDERAVSVPLYLDESRTQLLAAVALARHADVDASALSQRGVALIAWS